MDWDYYPGFISDSPEVMAKLYLETQAFLVKGIGTRYSCVFTQRAPHSQDSHESQNSPYSPSSQNSPYSPSEDKNIYPELLTVDWTLSPTLVQIRTLLETQFKTRFDYCLVHLYLNGQTGINWHNDKEALHSKIASLSLGATRKFRFRPIDQTTGWDYEYHLESGDLIMMKEGCQQKWKHTVPIERKVEYPRMNLTFRQFETTN